MKRPAAKPVKGAADSVAKDAEDAGNGDAKRGKTQDRAEPDLDVCDDDDVVVSNVLMQRDVYCLCWCLRLACKKH